MEEKKIARYPLEIMEGLIQGFEQVGVDSKEATFGFLSSLLSDVETNLKNWEMRLWELVVSAYPITKRNLMGSFFLFSEDVKTHALFEYHYHLKIGTVNDWPFFFTKAVHLGALCKDENDTKTIVEEFNELCIKIVPLWDTMHPAAQMRLVQILDEISALNPESRFLDRTSPIEEIVIPELSQRDIMFWLNLANELKKDEKLTHLLQDTDDMLKLLRWSKCVKHGHIERYTDISADMVQVLLLNCIFSLQLYFLVQYP